MVGSATVSVAPKTSAAVTPGGAHANRPATPRSRASRGSGAGAPPLRAGRGTPAAGAGGGGGGEGGEGDVESLARVTDVGGEEDLVRYAAAAQRLLPRRRHDGTVAAVRDDLDARVPARGPADVVGRAPARRDDAARAAEQGAFLAGDPPAPQALAQWRPHAVVPGRAAPRGEDDVRRDDVGVIGDPALRVHDVVPATHGGEG